MGRKKKGLIGGVAAAIFIILLVVCCIFSVKIIPVGYVGVVYSARSGIEDEVLDQWFNFVAPDKKVKKFTIGNEQLILTKDKREGSKENESFNVSTADDASINIDFQMSYRFYKDKVVDTYKSFKGLDGEDIVENRVRTVLKSKVSEVTTNYSMMDIYSGDRNKINNEITDYLNKEFTAKYGIEVIDASIIDVNPDKELKSAIDNRVKALQQKQQAEAEQETAKVEAATNLIKAENEAAIKIKEAEAEAESNRLKASSITSELIQMKEAEARLQHGWITVQGAENVIADGTGK